MFQRSTLLLPVVLVMIGLPRGDTRGDESGRISTDVVSLASDYCLGCHNADDRGGDFSIEPMMIDSIVDHSADWERVVKKLRAGQMPPLDADQPDKAAVSTVLEQLERSLDERWRTHPRPGRTETLRRLTGYEYQNAIRDLLALEIDAGALLPRDDVSHGFDNVTVGELSPVRLSRYVSAAQKISSLAIGRPQSSPDGRTVRVRADVTQEEHVEGLPLGTRGGTIFNHHFPRDGQYEFSIRLSRDRNEHVEGLSEPHEVELLVDGSRARTFMVKPPRGAAKPDDPWGKPTHENVDQHLNVRLRVTAGPHRVGVTFLKNPSSLLETKRQPLNVSFNMYRHPRIGPAIYQVSIVGPFQDTGPGETPSRKRILVCQPTGEADEDDCARAIIASLMRRASRRPVTQQDMSKPLTHYRQARSDADFEAGIEAALSYILISPEFLFRVERDPSGVAPGTPYRISDLELASRLSFFLWSSLPDEQLLTLAERGRLSDPSVLVKQTARLLADDRADALVENFASQWLYLRNLDAVAPDARLFPDFDDNLRNAFRRETELLFASILREDRSVFDLLRTDHTFLNERLAKHYGIPHVYGNRFRRVALDSDSNRGGLLRHGSILSVTSYATRTSPVIRGKWVLENLIGTPPPPPPPNVPALAENQISAQLSVRQRLAQHRADAACASCHRLMDPLGFSLEYFDAVGRWRDVDQGRIVDAFGGLPDGSKATGAAGLEQGLLNRPEMFVGTMVEKLLTYALGRGIEHDDAPAVRKIVRDAKADDYRFSALIQGIVRSTPFQMRMAE